jgi:hypothetical protein
MRRPRRPSCSVLVTLILLACPATGGDRARAETPAGDSEYTSLETLLTTGLKARRPEETAFIADVVGLVNAGKLPRKVVDSTYLWAIRRRRDYPFPAFERAVRMQAERLGVDW